MKGNTNKKWQDVADLFELPVGRRSLARLVAFSTSAGGCERDLVSAYGFSWRSRAASHKEHGVAGAPANLRGCLSHPGAMTAWNRSCWPEGPGEQGDYFEIMHWYYGILHWSRCYVYKCIRMLDSQHNSMHLTNILHDQTTNIRMFFPNIWSENNNGVDIALHKHGTVFVVDLPLRLTCCSVCRRLRSGLTWTWRRPDTRHRPAAPSPGERSTVGAYTPRWPASPSSTHSN